MRKKVVLLLANDAASMINFRGELLLNIRSKGYKVYAAAPGIDPASPHYKWLASRGIVPMSITLGRTTLNPLRDFMSLLSFFFVIRTVRPDVVLSFTIKPVVYGTIAAWLARVPRRYALITGLGYAFTGEAAGLRGGVRNVARRLYKFSLRRAHAVIFQNADDATEFAQLGLVPRDVPIEVVQGSGVDLIHYSLREPRAPDGSVVFLMIARLLKAKGVLEYAAAAAEVKKSHPKARFLLIGGLDQNPDAVSEQTVETWKKTGSIEWLGTSSDVRCYLAECDVFVLPSYREGTPRAVLEALATGRAIITTDAPGCRETVQHQKNGFLVKVGDSTALASAMRDFLNTPSLIPAMGVESRSLAESKYNVQNVNREMFRIMKI